MIFERVVALTEIISMLAPACLLQWVIQFVQQFLLQPGLNHMEDVRSYLRWLGLLPRLNLRREVRTTGKFYFPNFLCLLIIMLSPNEYVDSSILNFNAVVDNVGDNFYVLHISLVYPPSLL